MEVVIDYEQSPFSLNGSSVKSGKNKNARKNRPKAWKSETRHEGGKKKMGTTAIFPAARAFFPETLSNKSTWYISYYDIKSIWKFLQPLPLFNFVPLQSSESAEHKETTLVEWRVVKFGKERRLNNYGTKRQFLKFDPFKAPSFRWFRGCQTAFSRSNTVTRSIGI